ncbi:MAG: AsmA-like C-terminal region-containing protein [Bacteroidota bacterium]
MKKKLLRITGITVVIILGLLIALPFFLEGKIATIIKNKVNENINATLDFESANLSLIKSFPYAFLDLQEVSLVNKAPFEGDTLFAAGDIALELSFKELFKSASDPIGIKKLTLDGALLHIKVDTLENANYDIAVNADEEEVAASEGATNFTLDLQEYALTNARVIYDDFASGMHLEITEMHHSGSGDLSLETSELQTKTDALVSFAMGGTQYLNNNTVALDALVGIDLTENKYSFLDNQALINQLPLVFEGFVRVNENNQEVDLSFTTPSSDFKNFLALIPEAYSKNIENVQTTGNFEVNGQLKGVVDEEHIPTFEITLKSDNASFKYPDLPKAVRNVYIDTEINNETGITEDTYVHINRLSFQIDQDQFNLNAKARELLGNPSVNLHADGRINLANISQAYPVPEDYNLSGMLNADITTAFTMEAVEKHQYEKTQTSGTASVTGFIYNSPEMNHPVAIDAAAVRFTPQTVRLDAFEGQTGQTDFKAEGTIDNILGYVFNSEEIEGQFSLQSNTLAVNDFMVEEPAEDTAEATSTDGEAQLKIPSFLNCTITANATTVLYDNLVLKNVAGQVRIEDETAYLENLTSSLFDGTIGLTGKVSTKGDTPIFDMSLGLDAIKISESFQALDLFKVVAPLASALEGRLNTDIALSGNLKADMTPDLGTLSGDVLAQLLSAQVATKNAPLLSALDSQFRFIDMEKLDLNDLKTALSFEGGKVAVKPFALKYQDIAVNVSGSHTFDKQMQYQATLDVPAKYLGDEVTGLLAKIDDDSLEELTIPVTASIGGNYTSPKVSTDLSSGVKDLTGQLVEIQKQKLLNQGKAEAKNLIGGLLGKGKTDSTQTTTAGGVTEALGGLLGTTDKDSTVTDSATTENTVKKAAKGILGGLLGNKKKKDTVKN